MAALIPRTARPGNDGTSGNPERHAAPAQSRGPLCVASRVFPLARHAPADRWTTTASRSPGLRLDPFASPSRVRTTQWSSMQGTPRTVAGAARVSNPSSLSIPLRGTCREPLRCLNSAGRSTVTASARARVYWPAHDRSGGRLDQAPLSMPMKRRNSARVRASSRNTPSILLVTIDTRDL